MDTIIVIKLILLFMFISAGAYFSGIETSLLSLTGLGLTGIKNKYPKIIKCLNVWETNPDILIATILVGTNLTNIGAGVISISLSLDTAKVLGSSHWLVLSIPLIAIVLILIFSEIAPKVYSRFHPEAICIRAIPSLIFFSKIISPVTIFLVALTRHIMKFFKIHKSLESPFITKDELQHLLHTDTESSLGLSKQEKRLFSNILEFAERRIQEVMIPRTEIFAIDYNLGIDAIVNKVLSSKFSRIPVYKGTQDNIIGIIYTKDLILTWPNRKLFILEDLVRPAYFVPENILVDNLIREFKSGKHHMAIVVDEYGVTQGLITVEDVVEEIVGEIYDEYDIREKTIVDLPSNNWIIKATESINKVNSELNLEIPQLKTYTTFGGWVLTLFKRIPYIGEKTKWKDFTLEIVDADRKRIKKIKVIK
ncbi:MAG: hypothetical protein A2252_11440 [Elusimicrobia bacterium RIFOXYA2_FULL_39_19]|nr:MAG: hypothetical protein A2252_11440 [Elusimicrobia bacterium RIFOXYA2_FULL_39_19]